MGFRRRALALQLSILATCVVAPSTAGAATFQPTLTYDDYNAVDTDNGCSLREAVEAANTDGDFGGCTGTDDSQDTITLLGGTTYSLGGLGLNGVDNGNVTGDLDVLSEPLDIVGDPSFSSLPAGIDGNGATTLDRVLDLGPGGNYTPQVRLTNLSITDGNDSAGAGGSGIRAIGASTFSVTDSDISGNFGTAGGAGGGIKAGSGGPVTITDTTISGNSSGAGGGLFNEQGMLTITGSTISGNSAKLSNGVGGGIAITSPATASIVNSTISGNTTPAAGGGLHVSNGNLGLSNVTVSDNRADTDNTGGGDGGGMLVAAPGSVTVENSIFNGNVDQSIPGNAFNDCAGTVNFSFSLIQDPTGCTGAAGGDNINATANLGLLADNGGPTKTHTLQPGSAAIGSAEGATCLPLDQRGQPRPPFGVSCDMGAVEIQPPVLGAIGGRTVQAGFPLTFAISATDPDPTPALIFSATVLPAGATFDAATRTFSWTPSASQVGTFPASFKVGDGTFEDSELINITVTPVNVILPPVSATLPPVSATGQRAAALKKCKKKKTAAARRKCRKRARRLPV